MTDDSYISGGYLMRNPTWHAEDSAWKTHKILEIIHDNRLEPQSVCDIGCGAGKIVDRLARELCSCPTFIGIEVSPQAHALCKQMLDSRVDFQLRNTLDAPIENIDLVLAIDVVEHVRDYLGFLERLQLLGTYKLLHIPLDLSVLAAMRSSAFTQWRRDLGHLHYFTAETATAALNETGHEILDMRYTAGAVELPAQTLRRKLARLPRKVGASLNINISARFLGGFSLLVLTR